MSDNNTNKRVVTDFTLEKSKKKNPPTNDEVNDFDRVKKKKEREEKSNG